LISRKYSNLKAVSEIVSVLILLGISVVAGYFIYRGYVYQAQRQQYSVSVVEKIAYERIRERFSILGGYIRIINSTTKEFVLVIYNHGETDLKIWKVHIPAIIQGGDLVYLRYELNITIPSKEIRTIKITIDDPTLGYAPGMIARILLYTQTLGGQTPRIYEFNVSVIQG